MSLIKINLGDDTYEIDPDRLTLGEARVLKRDYGMMTFEQFEVADPDVLTGLLAIAVCRAEPDLNPADVQKRVESVEFVTIAEGMDFEQPEAADPDPQSPGGNASTPGKKRRSPATTQKRSGTPR